MRGRGGVACPVPDVGLDPVVVVARVVERAAIEAKITRFGAAHGGEQVEAGDIGIAAGLDEVDLGVDKFLLGIEDVEDRAVADGVLGAHPFKAEHGRVSVRNIRRKAKEDLEALKKDGGAGEDDIERAEKELENLTKAHVDKIDEALKNKEAELLEV